MGDEFESALPAGWARPSLGELLGSDRDITYGIVQPGSADPAGVPIVRVRDIRDGRVEMADVLRVHPHIEASYERSRLRGGEVLLTLVGSVGESAVAPVGLKGWNVARAVAVIRVREDIGNDWVSLVLRSPALKRHMDSRVTTTVQATLNLRDVRQLPIPVPPAGVRRSIVELFHALDGKIDSNHRIAQVADDLITADVSMALNDGWPRVSVSSLAEFINGGAFTKNASGTGRMVIRIAELNGTPGGSTVYNDLDIPDEKLARPGDLLMAWSGSLGVYRWTRPEAIINQHIFKVIPIQTPRWLVYSKLIEVIPQFRQIAADKATTMGHIKRHHLDDACVRVPPPTELAALDRRLGPVWDRIVAAEVEALTLEALRDALLPELLSGRLRVKEADEVVEAAM